MFTVCTSEKYKIAIKFFIRSKMVESRASILELFDFGLSTYLCKTVQIECLRVFGKDKDRCKYLYFKYFDNPDF